MNPKLLADRYRRWTLERAIKKAESALVCAPPEKHGEAWDKAAALHLKRDNLDPVIRGILEGQLSRRHG